MSTGDCIRQETVLDGVRRGSLPPELEAHCRECASCAELRLVAAALRADAEQLGQTGPPLPDPAAIWLRAQLAERDDRLRRATRSITWIQRATIAASIAIGAAFAPGWLARVRDLFVGVDLSPAALDLPRSAGSPLLVVAASFLVVGILALWELTAVRP